MKKINLKFIAAVIMFSSVFSSLVQASQVYVIARYSDGCPRQNAYVGVFDAAFRNLGAKIGSCPATSATGECTMNVANLLTNALYKTNATWPGNSFWSECYNNTNSNGNLVCKLNNPSPYPNGTIDCVKNGYFGKELCFKPAGQKAYVTCYVDIPTVTISSPTASGYYHKYNVLLSFAVDKPVSWIGYSLNNAPIKTIPGYVYLSSQAGSPYPITDGSKSVKVFAGDALGNVVSSTKSFFYCFGDVNHDKKVNDADIGFVSRLFGCNSNQPCYTNNTGGIPNSAADLNDDGKIDTKDIGAVSKLFLKNCA